MIRDRTHTSGFPGLVLPGTIILGCDAGRTVANDLLGGHQVILVDQVADVGPAKIVPA